MKQVGDDEWTERAREIALSSTNIEDFFSKYRENVDFNGTELDDNNIRLLISDIFYDTKENVIEEDVDEYYYSVEDIEEDTVEASFNVETEENVMPDDWLSDVEEAETAETETDVSTMPSDWLDDEEEETVQEVENLVFEVQKVVVDSELKESSLSNPKMIDKNTKPIEFASIIAKDKELRDRILKGTEEQEEIEGYIKKTLEVKERQLRLAKEKQAKEGVFAYKNTISKPYKDIKEYQEYKY